MDEKRPQASTPIKPSADTHPTKFPQPHPERNGPTELHFRKSGSKNRQSAAADNNYY
jgi:hypothetical protein